MFYNPFQALTLPAYHDFFRLSVEEVQVLLSPARFPLSSMPPSFPSPSSPHGLSPFTCPLPSV